MLKGITLYLCCITFFSVTTFAQNLEINSISPSPNQLNVDANSTLTITFNLDVDNSTVNASTIVLRGSQSGVLPATYAVNNAIVVIDPASDFRLGERISLTLTTGIQSSGGSPLQRGHTYSFTIRSATVATSALSFAQRDMSSIGQQGREVQALDYDKDGDLDILASAEGVPERLHIFENRGNNEFCAFQPGVAFRFIEMFDIDGDGDFDSFGSTGAFDTEINWFENEGSTPFTERFISSTDPWTMTGGDIDSDGDIDLLAAVLIPNRLLWFANDGSGNFSSGTSIPTSFGGGSDSYFHIVDMNGDGAMDILAFQRDDRTLVWYENDGSQSFTEININTGTDRSRIEYGDIDSDGDIDIARSSLENSPSEPLSWFENTGSSFTEHPITTSATNRLAGLFVGDADGDGATDILAGAFLFRNDGSQNFAEVLINEGLSTGFTPFSYALGLADMDEDGDIDLLSTGIYAVSWQERTPLMQVLSTNPQNGDVDVEAGTGIQITFSEDVGSSAASSIRVYSQVRGNIEGTISGSGSSTLTFQPNAVFLPGEQISVSIHPETAGADGKLETGYGFTFQAATRATNQFTFSAHPIQNMASNVSGLDVADIDGDGDIDLLSTSFSELFWHENDGNGSFTPISLPISDVPVSVFATDYNTDGFMDIWIDYDGGSSSSVYLNDGSQNFSELTNVGRGELQQTLDINHDGDTDLLFLAYINDWILWTDYACEGHIEVGNVPRVATRAAVAADIDNDGDTDFIGAAFGAGASLYENVGHMLYINSPIDNANTIAAEIADLNNDNIPDPIFIENFSALVWYQTSLAGDSISFGARQEIAPLNQDPRDVLAADIDGDGDPDVVGVSRNDDKVVWYENRLNEVGNDFGPEQSIGTASNGPIQVEAADLDGDGDLDIIVISEQDDRLIWFENNGTPVGIHDNDSQTALTFHLAQNYPNPFNPSTTIEYSLPRSSTVTLVIYNTAGQKIKTLVNAQQKAGSQMVDWDGTDDSGNRVASGIYLYRLKVEDNIFSRKMLLVR
ncbi:MAG: FG-GAP-like repeat-containing protein [Calditrichia bacterium]